MSGDEPASRSPARMRVVHVSSSAWTHLVCLSLFVFDVEDIKGHPRDRTTKSPTKWYEFEGNQWYSFENWRRNNPAGRQYASATSFWEDKPDGTSREVMVMDGGERYDPDNTTWIYDPQATAWEAVVHRSQPRATTHHSLVTLCRKRVLLFGGSPSEAISQSDECKNETWMFTMAHKQWEHVNTVLHPHSDAYVIPRCRHTATVVRFDKSPCSCKDAMLIYSGFRERSKIWTTTTSDLGDLWLLTCKDELLQVYEWIRLRPRGLKPRLRHPRAVSAYDNTVVYLFGAYRNGHYWEIWSYRIYTNTWDKVGNSTKQTSVPGKGVYVTDRNQSYHFLVSCCSQPLIVFDIVRGEWYSPEQISKGETPNLYAASAAVSKLGDSILVFGGSNMNFAFRQDVLWNLTVRSACSWFWTEELPQRHCPLKGRIFSVSGLVENQTRVLLFGGTGMRQGNNQLFQDNMLHVLDLRTLTWSVDTSGHRPQFAASATGVVLYDSIFVIYGGVMVRIVPDLRKVLSLSTATWGYHSYHRVWVKYLSNGSEPPRRAFHCSVATDSRTMMMYGGIALDASLISVKVLIRRDLWSFTLPQQHMYSSTLNVSSYTHQLESGWSLKGRRLLTPTHEKAKIQKKERRRSKNS